MIYAIEPSMPMRVGLMTRVALDDRLAAATTILPGTLTQMADWAPRRWGALVIPNALGHLSLDAERHLWDEWNAAPSPHGGPPPLPPSPPRPSARTGSPPGTSRTSLCSPSLGV
jgi:hypothetical protein